MMFPKSVHPPHLKKSANRCRIAHPAQHCCNPQQQSQQIYRFLLVEHPITPLFLLCDSISHAKYMLFLCRILPCRRIYISLQGEWRQNQSALCVKSRKRDACVQPHKHPVNIIQYTRDCFPPPRNTVFQDRLASAMPDKNRPSSLAVIKSTNIVDFPHGFVL